MIRLDSADGTNMFQSILLSRIQIMKYGTGRYLRYFKMFDTKSFQCRNIKVAKYFFVSIIFGINPFLQTKGIVGMAKYFFKSIFIGFGKNNFRRIKTLQEFFYFSLRTLTDDKLTGRNIKKSYAQLIRPTVV